MPLALLEKTVNEGSFIRLVLSPPRTLVRKLETTKKDCYQIVERKGAQEFHRNVDKNALLAWFKTINFKQGQLFATEGDYHLFFPNKVIKQPSTQQKEQPHNRQKKRLGKDQQVEKFLHEVQASLSPFEGQKKLTVIDFGCGKGYLTFALYEFLSRRFEVEMTGIDLKVDVMEACQKEAIKRGFHGLKFIAGPIDSFQTTPSVDLVVALHACDTATDSAIKKALELKARVLLLAPCCQHELYDQINHPDLKPLLKHGILRERFSALLTDALRGLFLERTGYTVKIVEFVDPTHTPKNTLIRAHFTGHKKSETTYEEFKKTFGISHQSLSCCPRPSMN